jgi:hypothetical protein
MSTIAIGSIVFAFLLGGTLLGIAFRGALPQHHLGADTKETVKLAMGLVATMAALVLGLLVASAKGSYDAQSTELTEMSAKVVMLDRLLAHYGPETREARDLLRITVVLTLDQIWPKERSGASHLEPGSARGEGLLEKLEELSPKDDEQRFIQTEALNIGLIIGETRWLMYEQAAATVSVPLLVVVVFWLTALFFSFGLFAPLNATVIVSFIVSALSVSAAICLIVEMYTPYSGLIQISSAPLRAALAHLGQ